MAEIVQNLRDWRRGRNWTQAEAGEKVGITQKAYSAYETGRNSVPGDIRKKLRKLGYEGPWPEEIEGGVTREDLQALGLDLAAVIGHAQKKLEIKIQELAAMVQALQEPSQRHPAP